MSKIEVRLNPDVTPAGSDLSVVNAARRSFNTRSEWDDCGSKTDYEGAVVQWVDEGNLDPSPKYLKPKDKRLLEFLARGMTAKDFNDFLYSIDSLIDTYIPPKAMAEKL